MVIALLVSLGPLVRPDFLVFSVVFGAVLVALQPDRRRRRRLDTVGLLLVVPVAFEVFRMAYYVSLVPNPALAKEAASSRWGQGWWYLADLFGPYWLWLPLVLLGVALAVTVVRARRGATPPAVRRDQLLVLGAPVLGGALSALYVVRVGATSCTPGSCCRQCSPSCCR